MSKIKEHAIGEKFIVNHIIYEVRPAHSCRNCSLYVESENECLNKNGQFEDCNGNYRTDGQDIKFLQLGEEQNLEVMF